MLKIDYIHEYAITISIGNEISIENHENIMKLYNYFKKIELAYLIDIVPSYCSLGLYFSNEVYFQIHNLKNYVEKTLDGIKTSAIKDSETSKNFPIVLDVNYTGEDLDFVANTCGLEIKEVIRLHAEPIYTVAMIGFLPGFPYMLGLNEKLYLPRKSTPSLKLKKGSVAIGGRQTGIYPMDSPGGWHVLGHIQQELYSVNFPNITYFKPGDKVKFNPVNEL